MDLIEKELNESQIYKDNFLDLKKYEVELPNKEKSTRLVVSHPGAVAILPIDEEGNVYLVKQYRFPLRHELIEIPAGKFDSKSEDPLECGKRELEEEIGKKADTWIYLGYIYTAAGFTNEKIHLYIAKDLKQGTVNTDEDEFIEIMKVNKNKFEEMIKNFEITDAKTIAAFSRAKLMGGI